MQRPGAAEGEKLEIAQIVPAHGRNRLDRLLHLDVDNANDALSRIGHSHLQRLRDLSLDRLEGGVRVELHLAAEEIVLAEIAEHEIAVRDRELAASAPVSGTTGRGNGTVPAP